MFVQQAPTIDKIQRLLSHTGAVRDKLAPCSIHSARDIFIRLAVDETQARGAEERHVSIHSKIIYARHYSHVFE